MSASLYRSSPRTWSTTWRVLHILAFTVIYALCFTLIKAGLVYAPALWYGGLRALLGGVALLGVVLVWRGPLLPAWRNVPALFALALTSTTLAFGGMFLSPGRAGAGIASVLGNTQPLFAVLLGAIFLGERLTRGKLVALALSLAGVTLITVPALTGGAAFSLAGALLPLAASAGAAAGSVIVKRMQPQDIVTTAAWQLIAGSLPLLGAAAIFERDIPIRWTLPFVSLLMFLALIGTAFTTVLWYWLVQREEVGRLTLFLFLTPVFGLGIATIIFGEPIGLMEGIGIAIVLVGIGATIREVWLPGSDDASQFH